ncbi:hypothetical protein ACFQ07_07085, partial [Actinomadura adrarensis]
QRGAGPPPEPTDVAAALVVLSAIRLNLDQTEARLLDTAQTAGMSVEQIAAVLDLRMEDAGERHRILKPRLDESTTIALPPPPALIPVHTGPRHPLAARNDRQRPRL